MPPAATTSQQALQNLQSFQGSAKSPGQFASANDTSLGIPAAQQQVTGLRGAINNTTSLLSQVAPSVMGRTQNSLVTSAQANRQIGNEQAPLNDQLNKENTDYSGASTDLNNLMSRSSALTGQDITGQQNQLSYLQGIYGDLSAAEQAATTNQLNRDQLNASIAAQKASAGGGGISLAGGGTTTPGASATAGGTPVGSFTRNGSGGYNFMGGDGKPVTMAQYLIANGANPGNLLQGVTHLLTNSNGGDKGIANAINSGHYTLAQLEKLYPQVFGGI